MHDRDIRDLGDGIREMFAGPLRVKLTVEMLDGTELYDVYPLGSRTIEYGQSIHIDHEIGMTYNIS